MPRPRRFSQGQQEVRIAAILAELSIRNGTFVEFGYKPAHPGANTQLLYNKGWTGLLMDGVDYPNNKPLPVHGEWISPANIGDLFRKYGVVHDVDYVSIDVNTFDLWIMRALLVDGFQPKVITIEYNSNFPIGYASEAHPRASK